MSDEHPVIEAMARKCCCPGGCERKDPDCPPLTEDLLSAKAAAKVLLDNMYHSVRKKIIVKALVEDYAREIGIELEGE